MEKFYIVSKKKIKKDLEWTMAQNMSFLLKNSGLN